jgi:hypothetical protein
MRLRVPAAKGNRDALEQIAAAITSLEGVKSVECNAVTGSVLVCYAHEAYRDLGALWATWDRSGIPISLSPDGDQRSVSKVKRRRRPTEPSAAARSITEFFGEMDGLIRDATDNELDLRVILPVAAVALGLLALGRARATPLWLTLMIFAFHSFLTLHDVVESGASGEIAGLTVEGDFEES